MELSSHEGEIPLPINSTYGGGHGHGHIIQHDHHHNHINISSSSAPQITSSNNNINNNNNGPSSMPSSSLEDHHHVPYKKMVRYRECLKNHAASMGGNATDGCGEFMPSGEEGSIEALTCSACNCHRNFHRKEIDGEQQPSSCDCYPHFNRVGRKLILGHHKSILAPDGIGYHTPTGTLIPSRAAAAAAAAPHHQMIMSYNMGSLPSESDEQEEGNGSGVMMMARPHQQLVKKRFRTKFTQEQKEKMLNFAEKVGWKIQKQEEAVVQQICQEIGVKRRVLKVWMHNNKHNLAKKNPSIITTTTATTT